MGAVGPYDVGVRPLIEEKPVDLRIGVTHTPKELTIELAADADSDALRTEIDAAIGEGKTLWVTDRKGRQHGVPAAKIAYVEIGHPDDGRHIGFGG